MNCITVSSDSSDDEIHFFPVDVKKDESDDDVVFCGVRTNTNLNNNEPSLRNLVKNKAVTVRTTKPVQSAAGPSTGNNSDSDIQFLGIRENNNAGPSRNRNRQLIPQGRSESVKININNKNQKININIEDDAQSNQKKVKLTFLGPSRGRITCGSNRTPNRPSFTPVSSSTPNISSGANSCRRTALSTSVQQPVIRRPGIAIRCNGNQFRQGLNNPPRTNSNFVARTAQPRMPIPAIPNRPPVVPGQLASKRNPPTNNNSVKNVKPLPVSNSLSKKVPVPSNASQTSRGFVQTDFSKGNPKVTAPVRANNNNNAKQASMLTPEQVLEAVNSVQNLLPQKKPVPSPTPSNSKTVIAKNPISNKNQVNNGLTDIENEKLIRSSYPEIVSVDDDSVLDLDASSCVPKNNDIKKSVLEKSSENGGKNSSKNVKSGEEKQQSPVSENSSLKKSSNAKITKSPSSSEENDKLKSSLPSKLNNRKESSSVASSSKPPKRIDLTPVPSCSTSSRNKERSKSPSSSKPFKKKDKSPIPSTSRPKKEKKRETSESSSDSDEDLKTKGEREEEKSSSEAFESEDIEPSISKADLDTLFNKFNNLCSKSNLKPAVKKLQRKLIKFYDKSKDVVKNEDFVQALRDVTNRMQNKPVRCPLDNIKKVLGQLRKNSPEILKNIKRLEKTLELINKKIKGLEEAEVTSDEDESDNNYLMLDRYRKRAVLIYNKICELQCLPADAERATLRNVSFQGTAPAVFKSSSIRGLVEKVSHALEKYYNKTRKFPDFNDVSKLMKQLAIEGGHKLKPDTLYQLADNLFTEFGEMLQRRRCHDDYMICNEYIQEDDPALYDPVLEAKLNANRKHWNKEKTILKQFTEKQAALKDKGLYSDEASETQSSSDGNSSDDGGRKKKKKKYDSDDSSYSKKSRKPFDSDDERCLETSNSDDSDDEDKNKKTINDSDDSDYESHKKKRKKTEDTDDSSDERTHKKKKKRTASDDSSSDYNVDRKKMNLSKNTYDSSNEEKRKKKKKQLKDSDDSSNDTTKKKRQKGEYSDESSDAEIFKEKINKSKYGANGKPHKKVNKRSEDKDNSNDFDTQKTKRKSKTDSDSSDEDKIKEKMKKGNDNDKSSSYGTSKKINKPTNKTDSAYCMKKIRKSDSKKESLNSWREKSLDRDCDKKNNEHVKKKIRKNNDSENDVASESDSSSSFKEDETKRNNNEITTNDYENTKCDEIGKSNKKYVDDNDVCETSSVENSKNSSIVKERSYDESRIRGEETVEYETGITLDADDRVEVNYVSSCDEMELVTVNNSSSDEEGKKPDASKVSDNVRFDFGNGSIPEGPEELPYGQADDASEQGNIEEDPRPAQDGVVESTDTLDPDQMEIPDNGTMDNEDNGKMVENLDEENTGQSTNEKEITQKEGAEFEASDNNEERNEPASNTENLMDCDTFNENTTNKISSVQIVDRDEELIIISETTVNEQQVSSEGIGVITEIRSCANDIHSQEEKPQILAAIPDELVQTINLLSDDDSILSPQELFEILPEVMNSQ